MSNSIHTRTCLEPRTTAASQGAQRAAMTNPKTQRRQQAGKRSHRIACKKVVVTWSGLTKREANRKRAHKTVDAYVSSHNGELHEYSICRSKQENASDGEKKYQIYGMFHSSVKITIGDQRSFTGFDMMGNDGRVLHPEVASVGSSRICRFEAIRYAQKHDTKPLQKLKTVVSSTHPSASRAPGNGWARSLATATSVDEAMRLLIETAPQVYFIEGERIRKTLERKFYQHTPGKFPLNTFNRPPLDLSKPIVLWGDTGTGKSMFARAHGKYPLLVQNTEDLKLVNARTTHLVFENVDFSKWPLTRAKALLCMDEKRSLPARYRDAYLEANLPMIFTTNVPPITMLIDNKLTSHSPIFPITTDPHYYMLQLSLRLRYEIVAAAGPLYDKDDVPTIAATT